MHKRGTGSLMSTTVESNVTDPLLPHTKRPARHRNLKAIDAFYKYQLSLELSYQENEWMSTVGAVAGYGGVRLTEEEIQKKLRRDTYLAIAGITANGLLFWLKITIAVMSKSMAVLTSAVETTMGFFAGIIILCCTRAMENPSPTLYPRGRKNLEPVAVVAVSAVMFVTNVVLCLEASLRAYHGDIQVSLNIPSIVVLVVSILVKVILWIVGSRQKTVTSKLLAIDYRNDVVTISIALIAAVLAEHFWKYADTIGALLGATFDVCIWMYAAVCQVKFVSGRSGDEAMVADIASAIVRQCSETVKLSKLDVYYHGVSYDVDILLCVNPAVQIMPLEMTIKEMQKFLESNPKIAKVNVSFEVRSG